MKRRKFDPLMSVTGTPTHDQYRRGRRPRRRQFRQLTLGGGPDPIPSQGELYRFFKASSVADYESVATASWQSGTTGGDNWNCLYYHREVENAAQESFEDILNPIRYEIDAPASNGGQFDWWTASGGITPGLNTKDPDGRYGLPRNGVEVYRLGTMAIAPEIMGANTHAAFTDDRLRWKSSLRTGVAFTPLQGTAERGKIVWNEATLYALAPAGTYDIGKFGTSFEMAYVQHYKNGSKLGPFYDLLDTTQGWWWIDPISPGDTYHADVWWRVKYNAQTQLGGRRGRVTLYIPTTKVSNGSRRYIAQNGKTWRPMHTFLNVDHTPDFNYQEQTYSLTFSGHTGWTIHNGSNTVTMRDQTGATVAASPRSVLLSIDAASTTYLWLRQINMYWDREIAIVTLMPGTNLLQAMGKAQSNELVLGIQYRPQDSSDHRGSVTSTEFGSLNVAPSGVFNQGGTTTFDLINWSAVYSSNNNANLYSNEAAQALLPATPDSAVPTSISVTRVDL